LNPFQRVVSNKERSLHCAVISPEPHSLPCGIVTAASIWKAQGHDLATGLHASPTW
jgi:hypothetical protein